MLPKLRLLMTETVTTDGETLSTTDVMTDSSETMWIFSSEELLGCSDLKRLPKFLKEKSNFLSDEPKKISRKKRATRTNNLFIIKI